MSKVASVLVVDDQVLFRSGLARLLNEDRQIKVVGEAGDGAEAIKMVQELEPDVVLMDLKMPGLSGIEATAEIVKRYPNTKVLILTTFEVEPYLVDALNAGARGYVLKHSSSEAIASSIITVLDGERVLSDTVANRLLQMAADSGKRQGVYDGLTDREVEILKLVAIGLANKQIAKRLGISEKTVRNHVSNVYEKLRIYDRSQAVMYALKKGLIEA